MAVSGAVTISGIGLASSLGGYGDACAAYRAGLNRFSAHPEIFGDEEQPLTIAPCPNLDGYSWAARTAKLFARAYSDFVANTQTPFPKDSSVLLMAMPDPHDRGMYDSARYDSRAARLQEYTRQVMEPFSAISGSKLHELPTQMVFGDRVAFARILEKAVAFIASGEYQNCLLMVADSLLNGETLQELLEQDQLKTGGNPVGYIPGEGAVFLWLSAGQTQSKFTAVKLAVQTSIDNSLQKEELREDSTEGEQEEVSKEISSQWHGDKLLNVLRGVLQGNYENTYFPQLISDINGQECRAREYGVLQYYLKRDFPKSALVEDKIPALGFAETGTLSSALGFTTTIASVQRNYAQHREFIMLLSEESGKRAAIKLGF
ncbi:hypothetical protein [Teredinibacter sp. KSP-S5-2]|uniref:hypothetical protein n=1 Tax=Teredinibacter sp. KSP-S5-2 TaxID=3034506 RepID=UPI0029352D38|nr:hypothetical protein [Teredinibacter sp. KSP-S5-2]WNO08089.1 hypothetical protein P5V12_13990 [Teredinibacter sp. KSP-S5-2]